MAQAQAPTQYQRGVVKQVLSADSVVIRGQPRGGPPPERTLAFSGISAPRLARRVTGDGADSSDEPFAWEAREFVRRLLVGKDIHFVVQNKAPTGREYGAVYIQRAGELTNVTELLLSEGLVETRKGGRAAEERFTMLEEQAKAAKKGRWADNPEKHVRNIKWTLDNPQQFADRNHGKEVDAIVEFVRDGCTVRAVLLPNFEQVTVMLSGIKCPGFKRDKDGKDLPPEPFSAEARYFVESRVLQRDIKLRIEGASNQNLLGTLIHPAGNISELLLQEGFAHCVDWSMAVVAQGKDKLRAAEKLAKEKRLRRWKDFKAPVSSGNLKQFTGKVIEIVNGDAMKIKSADGQVHKVFLSSFRSPKMPADAPREGAAAAAAGGKGGPRQLYEVPYMFEAREFMRKKLIHKKVNVTVDYVRPPQDGFPERVCASIQFGDTNVAEALIAKGLGTTLRHRQDDDQRSSFYDDLLTAETRAVKSGKGVHSKKETSPMRVSDLSQDATKAKQFLSSLQRSGRVQGVVEFVASGSRMRVFLPKDTSMITILLAGISCPRARPAQARAGQNQEGEPYGDEALELTRDACLQREVEIEVESVDRVGNYVGWVFVDDKNMSLELVKSSLASVHFSAERTRFGSALRSAEDVCKRGRDKIWTNYEEPKEVEVQEAAVAAVDDTPDRKCHYQQVVISHVESPTHFWVQTVESGAKLEQLMDQLNQEMASHPPLTGSYSPKRGEKCAAQYTDGMWYRAVVEKTVSNNEVHLLYVDFGNREKQPAKTLAPLPSSLTSLAAQAQEYRLACARAPTDEEWLEESLALFQSFVQDKELKMNIEYRIQGQIYVSLVDPKAQPEDVCRHLLEEGVLIVEKRRDRRLQTLVAEYVQAEEKARKERMAMWQYGDVTVDDAAEFGYKKN